MTDDEIRKAALDELVARAQARLDKRKAGEKPDPPPLRSGVVSF